MEHRVKIVSVGGWRLLLEGCGGWVGAAQQAEALETLEYFLGDLDDIVHEITPHVTEVLKGLFRYFRGRVHAECVGSHNNLGSVDVKVHLKREYE